MLQRILNCGLLFSLAAVPALAQTAPDTTIAAAIQSLTAQAAVVFAGEVLAIRPLGGVVEVDFSVTQTLKGQPSATVVLREWAGLWAAGQRRYWVGERAVIFLHAPGPYGLSSPVDGMEGILPLSPEPAATSLSATSLSATPLSVDIQRLRTRVLRDAGAPLVDSAAPMSLAQLAATVHPPQPIGKPIITPIALPIVIPAPDPIELPISIPITLPLPIPTHNLPILVMTPDFPDDLDPGDDPQTPSQHKSNTAPGSADAPR